MEDLDRAEEAELDKFDKMWNKKMTDFKNESDKMTEDLQNKHADERKTTTDNLERTLPIKVK